MSLLNETALQKLAAYLSPESPIRSAEFLKGRNSELEALEQELRVFKAIPFVYGNRGVGKTSLARTVAQQVTSSDREHIYVACAPQARFLSVARQIAIDLLSQAIKLGTQSDLTRKLELNLSVNPGIRLTIEKRSPQISEFTDINEAFRVLRDIDSLIPNPRGSVVVIDELEELSEDDRGSLAYLIKQIGDQDLGCRFMLVGIADNVHQLIGAHASVPRYLKEVSLAPLTPQVLMDIVSEAADQIGVSLDRDLLFRIAIIGNGYPHFAHLLGKALLTQAINEASNEITPDIYKRGVQAAVKGSLEELRAAYETATQRGDDVYKRLLWTLANSGVVDLRVDDWLVAYEHLASKLKWPSGINTKLRTAIQRLGRPEYGGIIVNTPIRYGAGKTRYRYKRFSNSLMKGHVRLQAESEGTQLGDPGSSL